MKKQIAVELGCLLKKNDLTDRFSVEKIMGNEITDEETEYLIELVSDELCGTELDRDNEPTKRGLFLEDIVDFLNRRFIG